MTSKFSPLEWSTHSLPFVEALYADYLRDPESVDEQWQQYFADFKKRDSFSEYPQLGPTFRPRNVFSANGGGRANGAAAKDQRMLLLQERVDQLVRRYRDRGHYVARIDPLGFPRAPRPELDPASMDLTEDDLDKEFTIDSFGRERLPLRRILERLQNTYTRSIGVQFMHIDDARIHRWLRRKMEQSENRLSLTRDEQLRILTWLTDAVNLEEFIQKKFLGAKSFSLEGSESLIPLLGLVIEKACEQELDEIVFGMAHRGRINVLANILGKSPQQIFQEFHDQAPEKTVGRGDVKYHLGYSSDWVGKNGRKVHLSLCFNPSHLEFVNPVALGRMRAKQDRVGDDDRNRGMVVLVHGDAAFIGEGIVQETLNLSNLRDYTVGGTLHVVVNNQIGFTTGPDEGRSSHYATAIARMLKTPVFHVNGEDPEAVAQVVQLAMEFRREFHRDVVIDMYCYRRRGHNEGDEPSFTQPLLYEKIRNREPVRSNYLDHLFKLGEIHQQEADEIEEESLKRLENAFEAASSAETVALPDSMSGLWQDYVGGHDDGVADVDTGVEQSRLESLLEAIGQIPEGFQPHQKIHRILKQRQEMGTGERPLDWATAELLAFATLATEGYRVRLSGQDSIRATFSQRHAGIVDVENGNRFFPLQHLSPSSAPVEIINSPLSEAGVLGFEYGYSLDTPDGLILWEAQFGDFVNAAQVIIDQFIASAEDKWRRLSGLVMLLPHGFEGMGPEHSSARLERFLMLTADHNIQVVYPTTPDQHFHLLRRQVLRSWRKPLVVMTPKSMLRSSRNTSPLESLTVGRFQRVIPDVAEDKLGKIQKILLCSGKVYFELEKEREEQERFDVAIVRLEQLYPLHSKELAECLDRYGKRRPVTWVQEEPENMGSWRYLRSTFGDVLPGDHPLIGVTRPESASPATGSSASHKLEQRDLIERAFSSKTKE